MGQGRSDGGLGPGVLDFALEIHESLAGRQVVDGSDKESYGDQGGDEALGGQKLAAYSFEVSHNGVPVEVDMENARYEHDEGENDVDAGPLVLVQSQEAPVCPVGYPAVGHDVLNDAREDEGNQRPQQKKAHIFSHFLSLLLRCFSPWPGGGYTSVALLSRNLSRWQKVVLVRSLC